MKNLGILISLLIFLGACKDKVHNKYFQYEPVYTDYETFRQSAQVTGPQSISEVGQIYTKDNYLFVVENDKGFHIIDNSDPSNPVNTAFVNLMGCTGLSIKGNRLFANSFIDLLVFDVSSMTNPVEISRLEDVFPLALPQMEKNYPKADVDKEKGVVTAWNVKEVKEKADNNGGSWSNCWTCAVMPQTAELAFNSNSGSATTSTGTAGSITKFTIVNDYLYVMDGWQLLPVDISNPDTPIAKDGVSVSRDVETLFPYDDYIFMGTPTGMLIYNTVDPSTPQYVSSLSHARGCDPVVVQDDFAYVTVRSGGPCGGNINQLDVIDVSNMSSPVLLNSYEMKNPHGLGIDGDLLMICDGKKGLRIFDASEPSTAGKTELHSFKNIQATDVIPMSGVAMTIGEDGIFQYDYSDPSDVKLLSEIKF